VYQHLALFGGRHDGALDMLHVAGGEQPAVHGGHHPGPLRIEDVRGRPAAQRPRRKAQQALEGRVAAQVAAGQILGVDGRGQGVEQRAQRRQLGFELAATLQGLPGRLLGGRNLVGLSGHENPLRGIRAKRLAVPRRVL